MDREFTIAQYLDNPVIWAILMLALSCYVLLFNFLLAKKDENWIQLAGNWMKVLPIMLSVLPLLGLLGTIAGLLSTFRNMSISGGLDQQALLSSGIADALGTTQLGLVTLIPGLLIFARLRTIYHKTLAGIHHEK